MSEKNFQSRVKSFLDELPKAWFFKSNEVSVRGIPDYIGSVGGTFVALELKVSLNARSQSRKLQEFTLNKIGSTGAIGIFLAPENWEAAKEMLIKLSNGEKYGSASQ